MWSVIILVLSSLLHGGLSATDDDTNAAILREFRVGVIAITNSTTPYDKSLAGAAVDLAFEKVNRDILNGSYKIVKVQKEYGPYCDANQAPGE